MPLNDNLILRAVDEVGMKVPAGQEAEFDAVAVIAPDDHLATVPPDTRSITAALDAMQIKKTDYFRATISNTTAIAFSQSTMVVHFRLAYEGRYKVIERSLLELKVEVSRDRLASTKRDLRYYQKIILDLQKKADQEKAVLDGFLKQMKRRSRRAA